MSKDWFDYLVGVTQIVTGLGVLAAFQQAKVTQKQLEITQAQLEEEQKNSKPEVHIIAKEEDYGISVIVINVKNVPVFVKSYTVEIFCSNSTKMILPIDEPEQRFGFHNKGLGVLNIGEHCEVWIPPTFFFELYQGVFNIEEGEIERVDIVFNIPGISPYPSVSLTFYTIHFDFDDLYERVFEQMVVDQITNGERERVASWSLKALAEVAATTPDS